MSEITGSGTTDIDIIKYSYGYYYSVHSCQWSTAARVQDIGQMPYVLFTWLHGEVCPFCCQLTWLMYVHTSYIVGSKATICFMWSHTTHIHTFPNWSFLLLPDWFTWGDPWHHMTLYLHASSMPPPETHSLRCQPCTTCNSPFHTLNHARGKQRRPNPRKSWSWPANELSQQLQRLHLGCEAFPVH